MTHNFDHIPNRRDPKVVNKWTYYKKDILPMWVADMDFICPEPILEALHERVAHGVFGYGIASSQLAAVICERMVRCYNWSVAPDQILFLPGLVCGLNLVCRAVGQAGDEVLVQTPVYPPFLSAPLHQERRLSCAELAFSRQGNHLCYTIDYAALDAAITERTSLFLFCNPHNPVGRVCDNGELIRLAEICESHDITICSDEIHCDLLLDNMNHRPIASLSPEIAKRCITLMAPSKTFNIPGLGMSFAIVQNRHLLKQLKRAAEGIVPHVNVLGFTAALAAYSDCDDWLKELRGYLRINRDYLLDYAAQYLPGILTTSPQATYLAWLDCRQTGVTGNLQRFFIDKAKVALSDGATFGSGGEGFVRLNFGCPRSILAQGLERMRMALSG